MGLVTGDVPEVGAPRETEESNVTTLLTNLLAAVNGNLDSANIADGGVTAVELAAAVQAAGGFNGASARRGKSIVSATESRTNAAYGLLGTPDRVSSIVLPTDGIIFVSYQATWQASVAGAGRAAIFLGSNQLKYASLAGPNVSEASTPATAAPRDRALYSYPLGLATVADTGAFDYSGDVTTGQAIGAYAATAGLGDGSGGACAIFAAAGTYDVSVQFKSASGSVTVKNRKMWVWSMGFD